MRLKAWLVVAIASAFTAYAVAAPIFPDKPVKIIMPFPTATGPDTVMRLIGEKLAGYWGQQVIVENKPGGNSWIALEAARRAAPDGYTLLQVDAPPMAIQPHLYKRLPYDPVRDFDPVASLFRTYYFVTVSANSKWKSVADLVNAAKANPGKITYGSSGNGGNLHLGGAMMETQAGVRMTHVPFKETSQIYVQVSTDQVDWAFGTGSTTSPLLKAGKIKYLAISGPKRSPQYSDVPTVAEAGGPADLELQTWVALFAPRGTPVNIVSKVNADVARALREPDVQERLRTVGFEPLIQSPDELRQAMTRDSAKYKVLAERLRITLD